MDGIGGGWDRGVDGIGRGWSGIPYSLVAVVEEGDMEYKWVGKGRGVSLQSQIPTMGHRTSFVPIQIFLCGGTPNYY